MLKKTNKHGANRVKKGARDSRGGDTIFGDGGISFQWWNTFSNFIFTLNIVLAFFILFKERKRASSLWAWILLLIFLPVIGFLLYLLFGQPHNKTKGRNANAYANPELEARAAGQLEALESGTFSGQGRLPKELQGLIKMQLKTNTAPLSTDNRLQIFNDGERKFDALFEDIKRAEDHIHLEYYILKNDGIGNRLMELLAEKAKEGVKVLFLYDDIGSNALPRDFFEAFTEAGGRAAASLPSRLPWFNPRINYRNHRKIAVIDGAVGYIGGFNVGDEYLGEQVEMGYWRDTHLRIAGSAVHSMQHIFLKDWNEASVSHPVRYSQAYFPETGGEHGAAVQLVASGPDEPDDQIKYGLLKLIASAQSTIRIQTPYFIPDESVLDAIRVAALSGIDVAVMIPGKSDHLFVHDASLSFLEELIDAGVRAYRYKNGFLHAKTMTVDGKALSVGSANLDTRSFSLNYEANTFIYDEATALEMDHIFAQDVKLSQRVTMEMFEARTTFERGKQRLARLFAPVL
ncbi:cardiolipin synthase [Planococcus sp. FY231025]|uniref:cardiolipin synthase n=1 Tax=Planococcus sp. FY231025 TaxID=3455699 RepID=UPI003F918300